MKSRGSVPVVRVPWGLLAAAGVGLLAAGLTGRARPAGGL